MRHRFAIYILIAGCALALGWFARADFQIRMRLRDGEAPTAAAAQSIVHGKFGTAGAPAELALATPPPTGSSVAAGADATASSGEGAATGVKSDDDMANASAVSCNFTSGNGAAWPKNEIQVHSAAYQDGAIVYDSIDIDAGSARLTRSAEATGARAAETDVQVTATPTGLHFFGVNPDGTWTFTTVFGSVDATGGHIAVMSQHGNDDLDHQSAQFYGTCTPKLPAGR